MLASYLLEISKINVCVIRLNSITQNRSSRIFHDVSSVTSSFSPDEADVQAFTSSQNPYLPSCVVFDDCTLSENVRPWKVCGSRVETLPWTQISKKTPSVVVVRFFRSNARPGVATLYPTKHKCIPKKVGATGSMNLSNEEVAKQRGLSVGKIKSEMRKIAFKIKKDQWAKRTSETLIVRPESDSSRKTDSFNFPAPKLSERGWRGQSDNKVSFESKSLKDLKERITKKKPKECSTFPMPIGMRLTASSSNDTQTSGVPSRFVLLTESKLKKNESSAENKAFSLPSPYFFIQQSLNKESLRGTFSDPSSIKEFKKKNKKPEEKPKDVKENVKKTHTPSPRLLASEKEGGSSDVHVLRRQVDSALKHTLPQKTAQDILSSILLAKEEPKENTKKKNDSFPCPSLRHSGGISAVSENVSRSSSHVWPDEVAFTSASREANPPKKTANNETAGYDDYLRKTDNDIRQKRSLKAVTKEVVIFKDDKNRQDLMTKKLSLPKESPNTDLLKKLNTDLKLSNLPSLSTLKENIEKVRENKSSSKGYGQNNVSNVLINSNNHFTNLIKENQSISSLQKAKAQDHSPFLEKSLNNFSSVLKKDMHSRSSNSGDGDDKGDTNDWELQVHSNKKAPSKNDDRQNESVGNYVVAEEGLPSGKRVLHLYSKRVVEVSSPTIVQSHERTQTNSNKFSEDEDSTRLNKNKSDASFKNNNPDKKINKHYDSKLGDMQKDEIPKSTNQETSGRRLILGKRQVLPVEEPDFVTHAELHSIEARNPRESKIPNSETEFRRIKPKVNQLEEQIEALNYRELNQIEAERHKKMQPSQSSHPESRKPKVVPAEDDAEMLNYRTIIQNKAQNYREGNEYQNPQTFDQIKPKDKLSEIKIESRNYGEDSLNNVGRHKGAYPKHRTSNIHENMKPKPVEELIDSSNDIKPKEVESNSKQNSSQLTYNTEVHNNSIYGDTESHREFNDHTPPSSTPPSPHRVLNPRMPVQGRFAPYYPSPNELAEPVDLSNTKFDRRVSKLSDGKKKTNFAEPQHTPSENIQKCRNEEPRVMNDRPKERRQPQMNVPEDSHSKHSSREISDVNYSEQVSLKSNNDQDRKQDSSFEVTRKNRTPARNSSLENLDSNLNPKSNISEFENEDKKLPANESSVDVKSSNSDSHRDKNKILSRNKKPSDERGHHNFSSMEEPNQFFQSPQTPGRFQYDNESTPLSISNTKGNELYMLSDVGNKTLNDTELEQKLPFDVSKLVKEKVKRNRDVSIESEIRQSADNQAFEYTLAEESKRSFEELKNLVNEGLNVRARSSSKTVKIMKEPPIVPSSALKINKKISESKHEYPKDDGIELKMKSSNKNLNAINSLDRKSLRNSYYHIGKAKSCLETFLENVSLEPGYLNSNQTSLVSLTNKTNEYNDSQPTFVYNHQSKFTKVKTPVQVSQKLISPEMIFKTSYDSSVNSQRKTERIQASSPVNHVAYNPPYNSNFEKNIVKCANIVNQLLSKSDKIEFTSRETQENRQYDIWDTSAVNRAAPKLQKKKGDWYNHYKNRNESNVTSNFSDSVLPSRHDSVLPPPRHDSVLPPPRHDSVLPPPRHDSVLPPPRHDSVLPPPRHDSVLPPPRHDAMDPSRSVVSNFDSSSYYSSHPTSPSEQAYSHSLDYSSNTLKSPSYSVSPSHHPDNQAQIRGQNASLQDDAMRAYKYAYDYYHDYYSKPNSTGAIDSIPPNLLNETHSYGLEERNNAQNSTQGLNPWSQSSNLNNPQNGVMSPSPDFSNIIDSSPDTNTTGNNLQSLNAPENISYADAHSDYWSRITTRNSVNPGMGKHYSHTGANHYAVNQSGVKPYSQASEMPGNSVNVQNNRQYMHGQEVPKNTVNSNYSHHSEVPEINLTSDAGKHYYHDQQQQKSYTNSALHQSYGVSENTSYAEATKPTDYEHSLNSEENKGKFYDTNVNDKKTTDPTGQIEEDNRDSVKYSPSGLRVYDKENRAINHDISDNKVDPVNEKIIPNFNENTKITNMDRNYSSGRGRMYKTNEKSTMNSRKKHTLKSPTSEGSEQVPPEFILHFTDNSKKGFSSLLDLPKNLSGYFQKIVSWKNPKENYNAERNLPHNDQTPNIPQEKHPAFDEIPSSKENTFEKFTKPIIESINRNVDSYYVKSVFVDNPMKSISKVAFAKRIANSEEGNCAACMKLSKLSSTIQSGVPFFKSKKLNYNFSKGYISSNSNPQNNSSAAMKQKDLPNNQNKLESTRFDYSFKKQDQSDEKLFNNYSMPFVPTKPRIPANFKIHEDLKAEELNYLNPHVTKKTLVINRIKANSLSKFKAMAEKKSKVFDKNQIRIPTRARVKDTNVVKSVTKTIVPSLSNAKVATKPIEESDMKLNTTTKTELKSKERVIKKKASNIASNNKAATDLKGKLSKDNIEIKRELTVAHDNKQGANMMKNSVKPVGISNIISSNSNSVETKIKRSSSDKVEDTEAVNNNNMESSQVKQSLKVDNGNVKLTNEKPRATKSLGNVLKKFNYADRKDNPYKAFSDLYTN